MCVLEAVILFTLFPFRNLTSSSSCCFRFMSIIIREEEREAKPSSSFYVVCLIRNIKILYWCFSDVSYARSKKEFEYVPSIVGWPSRVILIVEFGPNSHYWLMYIKLFMYIREFPCRHETVVSLNVGRSTEFFFPHLTLSSFFAVVSWRFPPWINSALIHCKLPDFQLRM